jgi:hypothetical protein
VAQVAQQPEEDGMTARLIRVGAFAAAIGVTLTAASPVRKEMWEAKMLGASETPANDSKGTGTARVLLIGDQLTLTVTAKGLSGPATAGHIHVGKPGVAGPPVFTFPIMQKGDTVSQGTFDVTKPNPAGVPWDSVKVLLRNGSAYVNVHTAAHPAGEIRGQLMTPR